MIDIEKTLDDLLSQPFETEVLEFKQAKSNYDSNKLGKYFSALSNEANLAGKDNAWLVFGVEDKYKHIVGSNFRVDNANLQNLKAEIASKTTNRLTFKAIYTLNRPEGRVILFQIPSAPLGIPTAWAGHYYGRDGEELNALNLEEIERIRKQHIEDDWSIGICDNATVSDLSEEAILKARKLFSLKTPLLADDILHWDDITFLNKAKLCIQGRLTHTAILLLGKPESEHFISPAIAKITWILKDRDNVEKDYEHFSCPFLLNIDAVYNKIRNLKYRYLPEGSLFPDEVESYDPYIIREGLNNCIAHQDYTLAGKINIIESEDSHLIFSNVGAFIPTSVENVIKADAPESRYRNRFLVNAMVNLNMIDTIGSGIKKMFIIQRKRFFPLPEYTLTNNQVKLHITGKILDLDYARKVAQMPNLRLDEIILLDKLQKQKTLNDDEINNLKKKGLIEGRKPNFHLSSQVAKETEQKGEYMKRKGIDDDYCKKVIINFLNQFSEGNRTDFEPLLFDKLSDLLNKQQKRDKLKNILQSLRKEGIIYNEEKVWKLKKQ